MIAIGASIGSAPADAGLIINPVFADSYTGADLAIGPIVSLDGDAAAESAIAAATTRIESQFANNVTVNILFYGAHDTPNGFLGASVSGQTVYTYNQYTSALTADAAANPLNHDIATAVANLSAGNGASDPFGSYVAPTTADARVLGLNLGAPTAFGVGDSSPEFDATGDYLGSGGTVDGIVFLNLDQPLSYTRPIQPVSDGVAYDAQQTMQHEIDEILGIGGSGSTLNDLVNDANFASDFFGVDGDVYGPLDLYRYSAPGVPSYVANPGFDPSQFAYFSIDGGDTFVDSFNQSAMAFGDAADWGLDLTQTCPGGQGVGGSGNVQDAFSCSNEYHNVSLHSPEGVALQAVGYNPVPEPWTLLLFGTELLVVAGLYARRKALN